MKAFYDAHIGELHEDDFESKMQKAVPGETLDAFRETNRLRTSIRATTQPDVARIIEAMMAVPTQTQRTPEWYAFRYNLLTASAVYKALGSKAMRNSLICEKCAPIREIKVNPQAMLDGAFHHGIKYEPLSALYYEHVNGATLQEFGCIPHPEYPFLGASPDGVNVNPASPTYGRAVEIKNPISRVITGNPKLEYWVQVQMQLAVCGLDQCDFLETKFEEYAGRTEFDADGDFLTTADGKMKGMFMYVLEGDAGKYVYPPFQCSECEFQEWEKATLSTTAWVHTICWKLAAVSCVLIEYNKEWFARAVPAFKELWDTILAERENGEWEKRLPKKRVKPLVPL